MAKNRFGDSSGLIGAPKYVLGSFGQIGAQNLFGEGCLNHPKTMV